MFKKLKENIAIPKRTTANWTNKNELTLKIGKDLSPGDTLTLCVKFKSISIYPNNVDVDIIK